MGLSCRCLSPFGDTAKRINRVIGKRQKAACCCLLIISLPALTAGRSQPEVPDGQRSTAATMSERIANYQIDVRLDPEAKTVRGRQVLRWVNSGRVATDEFCFHLYLNAFRNNRSTFARELRSRGLWEKKDPIPREFWGYTEIDSVAVTDEDGRPIQITHQDFIAPDDGNREDRTVWRLRIARPIGPTKRVRFRIAFTSKLPRGIFRTGWVKDYFFAAQWFPKIGVFEGDSWNCHQYHRATEYFADYGVYDVALTAPKDWQVGATGKLVERQPGPDGSVTHRYHQADVHDFAWAATTRHLSIKRRFNHPELPPVEIHLLLLPEHSHLEKRYFQAVEHGLRLFGQWFGPYPYATLTLIDPPYNSNTGGMEYPTLITGRSHFWSPPETLSPEAVTIHEVGHQWWYGLVANNEFEESWLDEGINSWAAARVQREVYSPRRFSRRFFGGIPLVFPSISVPFESGSLPYLRRHGSTDRMVLPGWHYLSRSSYLVNSYYKPELVLWTLERLLGPEEMLKVIRTYFERYRFRHPSTQDFMATVGEVTGRDWSDFFHQTLFSSEVLDYAVTRVSSEPVAGSEGLPEPVCQLREEETEQSVTARPRRSYFATEVVIRRLHGVQLPVQILMVFDNGEMIRRRWDGKYRWKRFRFEKMSRLKYVVIDPGRKLLIDIDPTNNSYWVQEPKRAVPIATQKWAGKWFFWLQNLLETFAFLA